MVKCKYWKTCKHYREDGYTCKNNDEAEDYCGVYWEEEDERAIEKVNIVRAYLGIVFIWVIYLKRGLI